MIRDWDRKPIYDTPNSSPATDSQYITNKFFTVASTNQRLLEIPSSCTRVSGYNSIYSRFSLMISSSYNTIDTDKVLLHFVKILVARLQPKVIRAITTCLCPKWNLCFPLILKSVKYKLTAGISSVRGVNLTSDNTD